MPSLVNTNDNIQNQNDVETNIVDELIDIEVNTNDNIQNQNDVETNIVVDELIDFEKIDYSEFIHDCPPLTFLNDEFLSSVYLQTEVVEKDVLLMYPLNTLCQLYYKNSKNLNNLAKHTHEIMTKQNTEVISLTNCIFLFALEIPLHITKE
jgi:hypothetical protein